MDNAEYESRIDQLWNEIHEASAIKDLASRKKAIEAVAGKIEEVIAQRRAAATLFLLGYAWYFHPERMTSPVIQEKVEAALRYAIELTPAYARAHMYLGHQAFDLGRYKEARSHFENVNVEQLEPYWGMKVHEMRVCCAIAIDGLPQSLNALEGYVQMAEQLPCQDLWPTQLAKWIKAQAPQLGEFEIRRVRKLAARLGEASLLRDLFSSIV